MKKKILVIANDTTTAYIFRKEIIQELIHRNYEVILAADLLNFANELKEMGCTLFPVSTGRRGTNPLADLNLLRKYRTLIDHEKPDAVLTYSIKPNVYGGIACQQTHTPYLTNVTGLGTAVEYPGVLQMITTRLYKAGVKKADCIFFQNEENRNFFISRNMLSKDARWRLLPGSGVNLDTHPLLVYPKEDDVIHFLFAARILKEKGIDLYLNAAKCIHEEYPKTVFHICGKCDDEGYIERLKEMNETDYIVYHGEQKNMTPFYEMAHCIVHPTYYPEGLSNVLLEAAAHGRPVITTDRAGCREAVDSYKTGMIIPLKDEEALVEAIRTFMVMDPQKHRDMGLAGRKKAEREFDRNIVVNTYMEEIENLFA